MSGTCENGKRNFADKFKVVGFKIKKSFCIILLGPMWTCEHLEEGRRDSVRCSRKEGGRDEPEAEGRDNWRQNGPQVRKCGRPLQIKTDPYPIASKKINCMKLNLANDQNKHDNKFSLCHLNGWCFRFIQMRLQAQEPAEPHCGQASALQNCEIIDLCCLSN